MNIDEFKSIILTSKNSNYCRENYIKKHFKDIYDIFKTLSFPSEFTFPQKIYHFIYNDVELKLGLCKTCKKRTKFLNIKTGYRLFCSNKCSANSPDKKEQIKKTCLEKYGCEFISQSSEIKEKKKQTCKEHFGSEYYLQTDEFKKKSKETCLELYGTEFAAQSDSVKSKIRTTLNKTCLKKFGNDSYFQTEEFKEKSKLTKLEKYGDENYLNTYKIKQTKLEKYGDENYNNREKTKQTCLELYNVDSYSKTDEYKEKVKQTSLQLYGEDNYTKTEEYKNKYKDAEFIERLKQNNNENFGSDWYFQSNEYKQKFENYKWVKAKNEKCYQTKKNNNSFNASKIEEHLKQYLTKNNINYITQYKSTLYPFSCDFYFPDKDLYVEIQGSWTHGPHPFIGSDDDLQLVEKWRLKGTKYYDNAVETWTIRDVKKREMAKENNLNYLEIFSIDLNYCINKLNLYIK